MVREWVYNCWNVVMDHKQNPLSNIPNFSTRHMIMQVLAWMWCIVFAIIVGSIWAGVFSMLLHALLLAAIAITVATFETLGKVTPLPGTWTILTLPTKSLIALHSN